MENFQGRKVIKEEMSVKELKMRFEIVHWIQQEAVELVVLMRAVSSGMVRAKPGYRGLSESGDVKC